MRISDWSSEVCSSDLLLKLFPDARFVLPLRDPAAHIASLVKQHRLFCQGERRHPAALDHMQRIGHFEFGLDRRPINVGDGAMGEILQAFHDGEERSEAHTSELQSLLRNSYAVFCLKKKHQ